MNPFNLKSPMHLDSDIQNQGQAAVDCVHSGHRFRDKAFIFCKRNGSPGKNKQTNEKHYSKSMERKFTNCHGFK